MEKRLRFASLQQYFTFWKHHLPSFFPKPGVGSFMNQAGLRALPLLCAFSDWALSGLKRDVQRQQGLSWSTSSSTLWDRRIISHLVGSTYGFVLHKYDAFLLRNSRALRSPCQLVIQHYPSVFLASFPPVVLLLKCSLLQWTYFSWILGWGFFPPPSVCKVHFEFWSCPLSQFVFPPVPCPRRPNKLVPTNKRLLVTTEQDQGQVRHWRNLSEYLWFNKQLLLPSLWMPFCGCA